MEGIIGRPVGSGLSLISAQVNPGAVPQDMPLTLSLAFSVPPHSLPSVSIAEKRIRHNYVLDGVLPGSGWLIGRNVFTWPSDRVLRHLNGLLPKQLSTMVRLSGSGVPSPNSVTLASLGASSAPITVQICRFVFRADTSVDAKASLHGPDGGVLCTKAFGHLTPQSTASLDWIPGSAAEGWYTLVVAPAGQSEKEKQAVSVFYRPKF